MERTSVSISRPADTERVTGGFRVLYVGGLGRSGSTLIERLLGELPGVCPVGELVHLWQRGVLAGERCGCGEPFHECPFWRRVGAIAFGGWHNADADRISALRRQVDRNRFIPLLAASEGPPAFRRALHEYLSVFLRLYSAVAEASGCRVVVDSSKLASLAFCLHRSGDLDLRVLHVVRDSRAVAYSWMRHVSRPDVAPPGSDDPPVQRPVAAHRYMTKYPPASAALRWNIQNSALHVLARTGTPTSLVRYEDVVRDPESALREVAAFVGVPVSDEALRFLGGGNGAGHHADLGAAHTVSGNPVRFLNGQVPIRQDDAWQAAMPAGQRRAVTALTLPLLGRYGYVGGGRRAQKRRCAR
jgi:sulfotransferase family protein